MTVNTTWVSPVSATLDKTTGNTIDETMTDAIASNFYHLGGTSGHIGARVYNSADISVANTTMSALTFNSERYDLDPNGAIHDTSSNTGRLTVRTAGKYLFLATVRWASNSTGYRLASLRSNGTQTIATVTDNAVNGDATVQQVSSVVDLAASDYVEVLVYQNSGGALNASASSAEAPEFMMTKV